MLRLRIQDDEGQRSEVPVQLDEITIGRDRANTICLPERNVSRRHVRLLRDNGHLVVEDTGSSFGTQVNGSRIDARAVLRVGDSLRIGDYEIELLDEAAQVAAASADAAPTGDARKPLVPAEHRSRLVVTSQAFGGRELLLDRTPMTIGRSDSADLCIDHRSVSAMHVRIDWTAADGYVVEDLDSANGVHVNGESYKRVSLRSGDEMELGHVRLRFVGPGEAFTWTPSGDEEPLPSRTGKKALVVVVVFAILAIVAVWTLVIDRPDTAERVTEPSNEATGPSGRTVEPETGTQVAGAQPGKGPAEGAVQPAQGEPGPGEHVAAAEQPTGPGEAQAQPSGEEGAGETGPGEAGAGETAPGEQVAAVEQPTAPGEGPADWMAAAVKATEARDWAVAIGLLEKVRTAEPDNREAESKLLSAKVELDRKGRIEEVEKRVEERNFAAAWSKVSELHTSATGSVYFDRIKELHESVRGSYVTDYLARAEKDLKAGSLEQANGLLGAVLSADPGNAKAKQLRRTVAKKIKEQKAAEQAAAAKEQAKQPETAKESGKTPKETAQATDAAKEPKPKKGGDGARLYHEGRTAKIQGNLPLAVERFKAAAKSGYPDAHKQLGVIYASQGKAQQAIHHYGKYLSMKPGAPDAAAVKTAIERLGGSP